VGKRRYIQRRKPYPRVRKPSKTVFTPAMWARWLVDQAWANSRPDEPALHLRAGIADLRHRLQGAGKPPRCRLQNTTARSAEHAHA